MQCCMFPDEILPGLSVGISSMRRGEKSRFLLSPKYAFKELGCPPRVPQNATGTCAYIYIKDTWYP